LIAWGFLSGDAAAIGWQNVCLLFINLWGVYRYLIRRKTPSFGGASSPRSRSN
jgi:hypothetical protein